MRLCNETPTSQTSVCSWARNCSSRAMREDALKQAQTVLETNKERPDAILLEARALAATGSTDARKEAARATAVAHLETVIKAEPNYR